MGLHIGEREIKGVWRVSRDLASGFARGKEVLLRSRKQPLCQRQRSIGMESQR